MKTLLIALELFFLLKGRFNLRVWLLFLMMILASFAEVLSIGAVIPFLTAMTNPDAILNLSEARPIFRTLGINNTDEIRFAMTAAFILAVLFSGIIKLLLVWFQARLIFDMNTYLSQALMGLQLKRPYIDAIISSSSNSLALVTNKAGTAVNGGVLPIFNFFSSIVISLGVVSVLVLINLEATIYVFLTIGILYLFIMYFTKKKLFINGRVESIESARVLQVTQEALRGYRDILLHRSEGFFSELFMLSDKKLKRARSNIQIISMAPKHVVETVGIVTIVLIAYLLVSTYGSESIAFIGAMALGGQRLLPNLQSTFHSWASLRSSNAVLAEILSIFSQIKHSDLLDDSKQFSLTFNSSLRVQNLSFKYPGNSKYVFKDLTFNFEKGAIVGVTGESGKGKSTLVDVLMGLLDPSQGKILVDDVLISNENKLAFQRLIAHVPQSVFLTDLSAIDNIAFAVPDEKIDLDRVYKAAKLAHIHDEILALPNGYHTRLGEDGSLLSGGQRQRIGIARALYRAPKILVLDEATSALDSQAEELVMNAIENLPDEVTIFIISHSPRPLKNTTYTIVL